MDTPPSSKRLRVSELNPHLLCALCGGYLIDATTIIECLHSFCKTCIVKYLETSKYCPICEVLIHKTRPWQNIRPDQALQNAVYKMVPGLFQNEMKRRREFYEKGANEDKNGGKNIQTKGLLGSRIIFSHDEEFSISIEFSPNGQPVPDSGNKSLKRPNNYQQDKRYLKCPAALRVSHLKKFIRSKFALPSHILIDLFHSQEPLSDSFTLMDVAYICLWKRDCVLRLFYSFFQKPAKRQPVETITKTVAEKVKEKHEVKGRERERAEREKEDQNKAATKKDKGKEMKHGKISGKKEVSTSVGPDVSQSIKTENIKQHQAAPKRKSTERECQTLSSPSSDKKLKKVSSISKASPSNKGLGPIATQVSPDCVGVLTRGNNCLNTMESQSQTEGQGQSSLSSHQTSNASLGLANKTKGPSAPKRQSSSANDCFSASEAAISYDNAVSSSSQKKKCPTLSTMSDICQVSTEEPMTSSNQNIQPEVSNAMPCYQVATPKQVLSNGKHSINSSMSFDKGSQSNLSKSDSQTRPATSTGVNSNSQNYPSVTTFARSSISSTPVANSAPKCAPICPSPAIAVPRSNVPNCSASFQNKTVKYNNYSLDNTTVTPKKLESTCIVNDMEVEHCELPVPSQKLNSQKLTMAGQVLPSIQNAKASHSNLSISNVSCGMNDQNSVMKAVANNKCFLSNFPTTSTSTGNTKPYCPNSSTPNADFKTTSCSLSAISTPIKLIPTPTPPNNLTKVKISSGQSSSTINSNRTNGQNKRKLALPMPSAKHTSSPHEQQTPWPKGDSVIPSEDDVEMTEERHLSSSQSNFLQRIDLLAKMADSETKPKEGSASMDASTEQGYTRGHPSNHSPTNICQSSLAVKSPGCDDVELIRVEFIDSPKKSSDQSRCDDSVQSLKSDDSGVATTAEIEDDSMDFPQKGPSPAMSTSPCPCHSLASSTVTHTVSSQLTPSACDSDKSRGSPAAVSKFIANGANRDSTTNTCSVVRSNYTTASQPVEYSKPSSLFINSSCQTTETGSMTIESSLMFSARVSPISEHRTMLRIPKDYIQPTDLSSKSKRDLTTSPDSEPKLTLCLPVSHLSHLTAKQPPAMDCERLSRSVTNVDSTTSSRAQVGNNGPSSNETSHFQSITSLAASSSVPPSSAEPRAIYLGSSISDSSVVSSNTGALTTEQLCSLAQKITPANVTSGLSYHKMPKVVTANPIKTSVPMQPIPKLTISNESLKSATTSRKNSDSISNKGTKPSTPMMGKNIVSTAKSTQPLKLTVTLSSNDTPIKVSPTPKESKKSDPLNQPSKTSQSSKSHSVARIIARSPSPSPPSPPATSKSNNNVIQTTKISTLIPKSSSLSSKCNTFSKQFSYPSTINSVPSSRSFLPNHLSHLSRADMVGLINANASFGRNSLEKNAVLSSFPSTSTSSMPSNSSHHHHHHHKTSSSKHKDRGDGRFEKASKAKTIPPLSIPKSCLISPPLKLQRSPGSTDHYIFTHQNPYFTSPTTSHNGERQRPKESSRHNGNCTPTSPPTATKDGERQRVPSIKISDINRNPIIVESGHNVNKGNNSSQNANHHHRSQSHSSSRGENGSGRQRSGSSSTPSSVSSSSAASSSRSAVTKEHRRPSDSEILMNNPWHMHSAAAEFLFNHPFKIAAASKYPNLHYDTDAMPLDYSQSSSKL